MADHLQINVLPRYCSNLYPKAESYRVCNWCLARSDSTDPALASAYNSSSSSLASHGTDALGIKSNGKKLRTERSGDQDLVVHNDGTEPKKQGRTPSPRPCGFRKRIITRGALEERLRRRRTKSEEVTGDSNRPPSDYKSHSKGIITKQVFRNKVRRYKLLDEVSS